MISSLRKMHNGEQQALKPEKIHSDRSGTGTSHPPKNEHLSEVESHLDDVTPSSTHKGQFIRRIGLSSTAYIPTNQNNLKKLAMPQPQAVKPALRLILRHLFTPRATQGSIQAIHPMDPSLLLPSSNRNSLPGATMPVYSHCSPQPCPDRFPTLMTNKLSSFVRRLLQCWCESATVPRRAFLRW